MGKSKKHSSDPKYIFKNYTSPSSVGSLSSLGTFVRNRRIKNVKATQNELNKIDAYTLYRNRKRNPVRRPIILWEPYDLTSLDIIDMHTLRKKNKIFSYIMLFVDSFSKLMTTYSLKTKSVKDVKSAFLQFIKKSKGKFKTLLTDSEPSFMSKEVQALFKKHNILHITSKTPRKASHAEAGVKTLKGRMHILMEVNGNKNWISHIDDIVRSQNSTIHSSTGMKASSIKPKDFSDVWMRLYGKHALRPHRKPAFKINDIVRVISKRLTFERSYLAHWSREKFKIKSIHTVFPVISYKISDLNGNAIDSTFTESDLQKIQNAE